MTGVPGLPGKDVPLDAVRAMTAAVTAVPGVTRMFFDLTAKPPGTTEWE